MKHLKRLLSLALVLVLTVTGLSWPTGTASAAGESTGTFGAEDVSAAPEGLLHAGEWEYWVEDGAAYIAGYTNKAESSLKIPGQLGGYPVVGIGHKAFRDNALSSVQIHTNVTRIANDAFAGGQITIRAYNGSYALLYAAAHGLKKKNLSTAAVFVEHVLDLTGLASAKAYSGLTDTGVTFRAGEATFLREGQILFFPASAAYPGGLAKTVSGLTNNGSTISVTFSQPQWGDVVERVYGSDELILDWDHMTVYEGFELLDSPASASSVASKDFSVKMSSGKWTLTGGLKLDIQKPTIDYEVRKQWWGPFRIPKVTYVKATIPTSLTPYVSLKYKNDSTRKLLKQQPEEQKKTLGKVPAVSIGGVINGYITLDLICVVSGSLEVSWTINTTFELKLQNGKTSFSAQRSISVTKFEIKGDFKWGPELNLEFVLGWGGFSITFLRGTAGAYVKISAYIAGETCTGSVNEIFHGDAKVTLEAKAELKLGLIKIIGFNIDKSVKLSKKLGPWDLAHFHVDIAEKIYCSVGLLNKSKTTCHLKNREVVYESNGKKVSSAKYDVNAMMSAPKTPTRNGYKFDGWYVNAKKSGLSGKDYAFNFRKNRMPYISGDGTFYLYAKWVKMGATGSSGSSGSSGTTPGTQQDEPEEYPEIEEPVVPEDVQVTVHVSGITLDRTSVEKYNDDASAVTALTATVSPANASYPRVVWRTSDPSVVFVNQKGEFSVGVPGTATITCQSISDPSVSATCTVTVKQHVKQLTISGNSNSLLPGETLQLTADCYPDNANDTTVTWKTGSGSVATVNEKGIVTAVGYGDTVITATTKDGTSISATYPIHVERELALEVSMVNDTVFLQGGKEVCLAYISPTAGSMERMGKKGLELKWSVTRKSGTAGAELSTLGTSISADGKTYESSFAALTSTSLPAAGKSVFTVTCTAGSYSASADVTVNADGTAYTEKAQLDPATFYLGIGDLAKIPAQPTASDGKPVPSGLSVSVKGDSYYDEFGNETVTDDGISVSFTESGSYTATVTYQKANITYEVPVTFYVKDASGVVQIRTQGVELDQSFIQLVEGKTYKLNAAVAPNDATDKSVTWTSSDPSVAAVSSDGVITAVKPGSTAITCSANGGRSVIAMCAVTVEAYLQLDEDLMEFTVYRSANEHADLGTLNLTFETQQRVLTDRQNVTWKLERKSGSSADIALEEFRSTAEEGVSVSGNVLKLVRMNGAGDDEYTLTCSAGNYTDQCTVKIHVLDRAMPTSVTLPRTALEGKVNSIISLDLTPSCQPAGTTLPENTVIRVEGSRVFLDALSAEYSISNPGSLIFSKAGTYQAEVVFEGDNYAYTCPVAIKVADENGSVPKNITDIQVTAGKEALLPGETTRLTAAVAPADAAFSGLTWSSSDTSVVTVSADGTVTAIGPGTTSVLVTAPETDVTGGCLIVVEDGMTLAEDTLERTVFVEGMTRMNLGTVTLTEASSGRLTAQPEWKLTRVKGNNLTLRAEPTEAVNASGNTVYGCSIILYSISRTGDTVYTLSCTSGAETAEATITVHGLNRSAVLPAGIQLKQTAYTADIGGLIVMEPTYVCYPAETGVPAGMKITLEGDRQFTAAINTGDFFVSQSKSTLSFSKAGTYHANYIMQYSNVKYVVPMIFRVRSSSGEIPVQASEVRLNYRDLNLEAGNTKQLDAVFSPADTSNRKVSWVSTDPSVATVDATGKVTAVANGMATITCTPEDTEVAAVSCAVTVEDYLTVIPGNTSMVQYIQGKKGNSIADVMLSVGTIERLTKEGITPVWSIDTGKVTHAELRMTEAADNTAVTICAAKLLSEGKDTYTVTCTAGGRTWSQEYTLDVRTAGDSAPTAISMATPNVSAEVGKAITIDFTPVLTPSGAQLPEKMRASYVGLGDFYEAREESSYAADGDKVTVAFTRAGRYILTRRYRLGNIEFTVPCVITVGDAGAGYNLLTATETEYTVYAGGSTGSVSAISLNDHMVETLWGDNLTWDIQRVSGDSLNAALKRDGSTVEVFILGTVKNGTDVWRVTAGFGGLSESVDLTLTAAEPRGTLPGSISLADDTITGVIGTWINVPLAAACEPAGSMLPDQGDEFWSVEMDAHGTDRSTFRIENGMVRFSFVESGYYTASLKYQSGNVGYSVPLYFEIRDEEDVINKPDIRLFLTNPDTIVYPEGAVNVPVTRAVAAESMSASNIGASLAYMSDREAAWDISITSGTAASLKLAKNSANVYDVVLTEIKGPGTIAYTVSCTVDGKTCTGTGSLRVADSGEERPDATLLHNSYQVVQGEQVAIDRGLYSKKDGSILQASCGWNPASFLEAAGYNVTETENDWLVTFYRTGTYSATVSGYAGNILKEVPLTIQVVAAAEDIQRFTLKLPAGLQAIDDETFAGAAMNVADLRETGITSIGSYAFRNCRELTDVYLPAGVNSIADNAFEGCLNIVFHCPKGSYAETYAAAHGIRTVN